MFIRFLVLAIIIYFIYRKCISNCNALCKNITIFFLNFCWFVMSIDIFTLKPKYSYSYISKQCLSSKITVSDASKLFTRNTGDYSTIFIGLAITILVMAVVDYRLIVNYSSFSTDDLSEKFYNLDTSKAVIDKIVTVTALIAAFIIILYKIKTNHSVPNKSNFATNFQYIFAIYLIPLQCAIDYIVAKNKNHSEVIKSD